MYLTVVMLQLHILVIIIIVKQFMMLLEVPEIKADVVAVMKKSAMAMTKKYPFKFEELEAYIEKIFKTYFLRSIT